MDKYRVRGIPATQTTDLQGELNRQWEDGWELVTLVSDAQGELLAVFGRRE